MNELNLNVLSKMVIKALNKNKYYKELKSYVVKNHINLFLIEKMNFDIYNKLRKEIIGGG